MWGDPTAIVTARPEPVKKWYQRQMAAAYGASIASAVVGGPVPFLVTAGFAPPLVHAVHKNYAGTAASFGVRAVLAGTVLAWADADCFRLLVGYGEEDARPAACDFFEAAAILSLIATPVVDFVMAYETLPPVKLGVLVRPPVRKNPAFFGVGGVF